MTGLLWVPYILDRIMVRGPIGAMANPGPKAKPHSAWAQRLMAAHIDAVENLVVFAPLVLTAWRWASLLARPRLPARFISGRALRMSWSTRWAYPCSAHCPSQSASSRRRCWCWQSSNSSEIFAASRRTRLRRLRKQRNLFEAGCFRQAEHDIHVLHRLAGGALGQIVERRNDNGAAGNAIGGHTDKGHVGTAHVPGLRRRAKWQHVDERFRRVNFREVRMKILRRGFAAADINGRQDAAIHRHKMRR